MPESDHASEVTLLELMDALVGSPTLESSVSSPASSVVYETPCAVCRLVTRSVERTLRIFFAEFVNDPKTREEFRRARGFCAEHTPLLATLGDALGVAILYSDLAEQARERWTESGKERGLRLGRRAARPPCPACTAARESSARYTAALAAGLEKPEVWLVLEAGSGLCVAHVDQIAVTAKPVSAARLRVQQAARIAALQAELEEIIRKNDYRFRGEEWGAEKDAWLRALRIITRSPD